MPAAGLKWEEVLEKGVVTTAAKAAAAYSFTLSLAAVATSITNSSKALAKEVELQVYENIPMRDGKNANNAFLQELPDPVSKVTWDNFVAIAPKFAEKLKVKEFDVVTVKGSNGYSVDLPVLIQPGQAQGTASIALGYGRTKTGKAGNDVGKNAFPFVSFVNGTMQYATSVTITPTGGYYELAQTQTHHSFEGRAVIKEATFKEYLKNAGAGNEKGEHKDYDLWDQYEKPGNNWVTIAMKLKMAM
ncbi:hypothetical protein D3C85_1116140 [compost metagenome]